MVTAHHLNHRNESKVPQVSSGPTCCHRQAPGPAHTARSRQRPTSLNVCVSINSQRVHGRTASPRPRMLLSSTRPPVPMSTFAKPPILHEAALRVRASEYLTNVTKQMSTCMGPEAQSLRAWPHPIEHAQQSSAPEQNAVVVDVEFDTCVDVVYVLHVLRLLVLLLLLSFVTSKNLNPTLRTHTYILVCLGRGR